MLSPEWSPSGTTTESHPTREERQRRLSWHRGGSDEATAAGEEYARLKAAHEALLLAHEELKACTTSEARALSTLWVVAIFNSDPTCGGHEAQWVVRGKFWSGSWSRPTSVSVI